MFFYSINNYGSEDIISLHYSSMGLSSGGHIAALADTINILKERVKMMFDIDLQSRTPIYEQLYKKILELILKQELKANDKLPSVRELAKELGINPNTVAKTFHMLEQNKVIYSLAGRGSFVADIKTDAVKETALADFDNAVSEAFTVGVSADELKQRIDKILNSK